MNYRSLTDINMTQAQIDADAAAIVRSAAGAVDSILVRREKLDSQGLYDTPLVVLAGELHAMPAHKLHHMKVLKGLADSGEKTVLGYEEGHNNISQIFFDEQNRWHGPVTAQNLQARHWQKMLTLQSGDGFWRSNYADHSRNILLHSLRRNNKIAVRFTDAATQKSYIDLDDPATAYSMHASLKRLSDNNIYARSRDGVNGRNQHMSRLNVGFAKAHKARFAVQHSGNAHIVGCEGIYPAGYSLSAYFKAHGLPVVAMPIFSRLFNETHIPVDHGLHENELLFRTGVPEKRAVYDPITDKSVVNEPADFECRAAEAFYANAVLSSMGDKRDRMSVEDYRTGKVSLENVVVEKFRAWNQEPALAV